MKNVIIAACQRSGSSMITSIFVAHGMWYGRGGLCGASNTPVPYETYENQVLKLYGRGEISDDKARDILPSDRAWIYKGAPPSFAVKVHRLFPDAMLFRVRRAKRSILKSSADGKAALRTRSLEELEAIDAPWIDSDEIMAGDFSSLESAFALCGMELDLELARKCIDPDKWHHEATP